MNQRQYHLIQIIQKIEVFNGLEVEEVQQMLRFCRPQSFESNQQIYTAGEPSTDMLILLQGQLVVTSKSGKVLGEVLPGASVGEMGVLTGQPRTANVIASGKTGGIVIARNALNSLLASNPPMRAKVLQEMVDILSERLVEANGKIEAMNNRVQELEAKLKGA